MKRKVISLLLSLIMVLSLCLGTAPAQADNGLTVKENLFTENFESGYTIGEDATMALYNKWSYIARDDAKNERLSVETVDGSSVLFIGVDNTPTGTAMGGPGVEIGNGDGYDAPVFDFTNETVQISFRFKDYEAQGRQFKVTGKDDTGTMKDILFVGGTNTTFFGEQKSNTVSKTDWVKGKIIIYTKEAKASLYLNDAAEPLYDKVSTAALGLNINKFKVRFTSWLWGNDSKIGYYLDDVSVDLMNESGSSGGSTGGGSEGDGDGDGDGSGDTDEDLGVASNLFAENFESGYTVGADATMDLYNKWSFVARDDAKNERLSVETVDGSKVLFMNVDNTSSGTAMGGPGVEIGNGDGFDAPVFDFTDKTVQISFRFKDYEAQGRQFKVIGKDASGMKDIFIVAGTNTIFFGEQKANTVSKTDWVKGKIIIYTKEAKASLYLNDAAEPTYDKVDTTALGLNINQFKVRFTTWLWGNNTKVGYYLDDVSIDLLDASGDTGGGETGGGNEGDGDGDGDGSGGTDEDLGVKQNLFAEDFESGYTIGTDATMDLYNKWSYVARDDLKNERLSVENVDGSKVLFMNVDNTPTGTAQGGPGVEAGNGSGFDAPVFDFTNETVQISFRYKDYNAQGRQFKVTGKDDTGTMKDILFIANTNTTFFGAGKTNTVSTTDWVKGKIIIYTKEAKASLYINDAEEPLYDKVDTTALGLNINKFKVRFTTWLWGNNTKVGYYLDDVSIDLLGTPGEEEVTDPTVSVTSPTVGQTFTGLSPITITANVTTGGNTIDRVAFYVNGSQVGEDTTAPYSYTWTPNAFGSYTLSARAYVGTAGYASQSVAITVREESSGGDTGGELMVKQNLFSDDFEYGYPLNADASMALVNRDWSFVNAEFEKSGFVQVENIDGSNALLIGLDNTPTGTNQAGPLVEAAATEGFDGETFDVTDETVQFTFRYKPYNRTNNQLKLTAKDINSTFVDFIFVAGNNLTFFGQQIPGAVNLDGWNKIKMILDVKNKKATLYLDDAETPVKDKIDISTFLTTANFNLNRFKVRFGTWMWTANAKIGYYIDDVSMDIMLPEGVPAVAVTSPAAGAVYNTFEPITLSASVVNTGDAAVSKVEFYANDTKVGEDTTAPYSYEWTPSAYDVYNITAKAHVGSEVYTSGAVDITVAEREVLQVAISSPKDGDSLGMTETELTAAISNPNNETVDKVAFFINGSQIGEDTAAPYSYGWTPEAYAAYTIIAKAYVGTAEYISLPVTVTVAETPEDDSFSEVISEYTFNEYTPGTSPGYDNMTGWLVNAPEANTRITYQTVEESRETSLHIAGIADNSNWAGGYAEFEVPATKVGDRFTVEGDVYFDNPARKDILLFQLRTASTRTFCTTLSVNGTLQTVTLAPDGKTVYTSLLTIQDKQWYRVKLDYNMKDKVYDLTITESNGTVHSFPEISLGNPDVPTNEGYYVRCMMNTMGEKGNLVIDNIRLTAHYEMPEVTSVAFRKTDGTLVTDTKRLPVDIASVVIYLNQPVTSASASQSIKLYLGDKLAPVSGSVAWDSTINAAVFTPSGRLAGGMEYTIEAAAGLVSAQSGAVSTKSTAFTFTTIGEEVFVEDAAFKTGGTVITSAAQLTSGASVTYEAKIGNRTGTAKTVTLLFAMYCGDQLESITAKTIEIPEGGASVTMQPLTAPASMQDITFAAWLNDGLTTRRPLGTGDMLK